MKDYQAKGYLLEVIIAKLLQSGGYKIIRKEDNKDIVKKGNELNVKGRGGLHQCDALGTFIITPPFTYPTRLFVEAKFQKKTTGIEVVRNGIAILQDINTNIFTVDLDANKLDYKNYYNYNYAIFSTSGFSDNAICLAAAHKIYLIDLSDELYNPIINPIELIITSMCKKSGNTIPSNEFEEFKKLFLNFIFDNSKELENNEKYKDIRKYINNIKTLTRTKNLFLVGINGMFLFPLFIDNDTIDELIKDHKPIIELVYKENNVFDMSIGNKVVQENISFQKTHVDFLKNEFKNNKERFIKNVFFIYGEKNDKYGEEGFIKTCILNIKV